MRVIRAAHELGIEAVAVYSQADEGSLACRLADVAIPIGPAAAHDSYLSLPQIMNAVTQARADAIHPGYGFLSENAALPALAEMWGVAFVGPPASAIRAMGDKAQARETARHAGVPVLPGSEGALSSVEEGLAIADRIGYPVLVKAAGGGGGRGIRSARSPEELPEAFVQAQREAESTFGMGALYLERLIERPRHIEIQLMADTHGNAVALGERESSLQRRRQKLLEEAPAVPMTAALRRRMGEAAVALAHAVGYCGAGTVEFLFDSASAEFYFLEMNTRIQVEHAVTEMVTGIDLVKEQLRVAAGEALSVDQSPSLSGWAIECRVNAEDPNRDFRPSPGTISRFDPPGGLGVRVDTGFMTGDAISPYYDSLVCKVIVHGRSRDEAIARMARALREFRIEGVRTTIALHQRILADPEFKAGSVDTQWLERFVHES